MIVLKNKVIKDKGTKSVPSGWVMWVMLIFKIFQKLFLFFDTCAFWQNQSSVILSTWTDVLTQSAQTEAKGSAIKTQWHSWSPAILKQEKGTTKISFSKHQRKIIFNN